MKELARVPKPTAPGLIPLITRGVRSWGPSIAPRRASRSPPFASVRCCLPLPSTIRFSSDIPIATAHPGGFLSDVARRFKAGGGCHLADAGRNPAPTDMSATEGPAEQDNEPGLFAPRPGGRSRPVSRSRSRNNSRSLVDDDQMPEFFRINTIRNLKVKEGIEVFSMWIFVRFLFYHAAYPISLPFVFLFDGSCFAYNMAFLPTADRRGLVVFGMQIVTAVVLWLIPAPLFTEFDFDEPAI
eukprot:1368675-Amorphochlora_amoeboformis.AAC.2